MANCDDCGKLLTPDDFENKELCRSCYLKSALHAAIGSIIFGILAVAAAACALAFSLDMLKAAEAAPEDADFYYVGIMGLIYSFGMAFTWGGTILCSFVAVILGTIALYRRGFVSGESRKKSVATLVCGILGLAFFATAVILLIASYGVIHWH